MDLAALAAIAGGADAEAVASAAREAEWRALNWTAEKLVLHAAQRAFVEMQRIEPHRVAGLEVYSTVLWHLAVGRVRDASGFARGSLGKQRRCR